MLGYPPDLSQSFGMNVKEFANDFLSHPPVFGSIQQH